MREKARAGIILMVGLMLAYFIGAHAILDIPIHVELQPENAVTVFGGVSASDVFPNLLTSIFLHASISHLVINLVMFIMAAWLLSFKTSFIKIAGIFMLSGVIANIASISINPATVFLGASCGVYGLLGYACCRSLLHVEDPLNGKALDIGTVIIVSMASFVLTGSGNTFGHIIGVLIGVMLAVNIRIYEMWREEHVEKCNKEGR